MLDKNSKEYKKFEKTLKRASNIAIGKEVFISKEFDNIEESISKVEQKINNLETSINSDFDNLIQSLNETRVVDEHDDTEKERLMSEKFSELESGLVNVRADIKSIETRFENLPDNTFDLQDVISQVKSSLGPVTQSVPFDKQELLTEFLSHLPEQKPFELDSAVQMRDKLETLSGLDRLRVTAIDGLEEFVDERVLMVSGKATRTFRNTIGGGVTQIKAGTGVTIQSTGANGRGIVTISASGSGGGTPGGSDTQIQFNDSGSFGGDPHFLWNKTSNVMTLGLENSIAKIRGADATTPATKGGTVTIAGGDGIGDGTIGGYDGGGDVFIYGGDSNTITNSGRGGRVFVYGGNKSVSGVDGGVNISGTSGAAANALWVSNGGVRITNGNNPDGPGLQFDVTSFGGIYTWTARQLDGTVALLSDFAGYLPLSGGTMTGDIQMGPYSLYVSEDGGTSNALIKSIDGVLALVGYQANSQISFYNQATNAGLIHDYSAITTNQTVTWRDLSGTVALLSDITGGGGLTFAQSYSISTLQI